MKATTNKGFNSFAFLGKTVPVKRLNTGLVHPLTGESLIAKKRVDLKTRLRTI